MSDRIAYRGVHAVVVSMRAAAVSAVARLAAGKVCCMQLQEDEARQHDLHDELPPGANSNAYADAALPPIRVGSLISSHIQPWTSI